jgi:predicted O-linked N-acetylglucosamine transferase (SPINDLY family)
MDIALDPFPYCGTTTTCEAMYMGVPVVTLAGNTHASRVGISLLQAAGLPELIARDESEYLGITAGLAADPARRASLRASLRNRMLASTLCSAAPYTRNVEAAYRTAWRERCGIDSR